MRKTYLGVVVGLFLGIMSDAQEADGMEEVMRFLGVVSPEETDPYEAERIADYIQHPLRINMVTESRLVTSGLLTRYQAASLTDYRSRHGNVMSFAELAAIDGFGVVAVERLRHFISLECHSLHDHKYRVQNDAAVKAASKANGVDDGYDWNYGLKYRFRAERFSLALSSSRSYSTDKWLPDAYSCSLAYDFTRGRGRVVIGDFNARFGQGLALWSGTFMTSLSSPEAFMKKSSGLTETWSFTGSSALTGLAGNFSFRQFTLSLLTAFPGIKDFMSKPEKVSLKPAVNLSWRSRHGTLAMTHVAELTGLRSGILQIPVMRTSVDGAFCVDGVNIFGEMAYDWACENMHVMAGTDLPVGDIGRMAALLRYLPSRWDGTAALHGAAMSASFGLGRMVTPSGAEGFAASRKRHSATFSMDAVRYVDPKEEDVPVSVQVKFLADWRFLMDEHWEAKFRVSERFRSWGYRSRTDVRTDVSYMTSPFIFTLRMNYLRCVSPAFAGYFEQGYKAPRMSAYLREGVFFVDDWEDRIYVYERDAPGSFNVPAMYGRGWFASIVSSMRFTDAVRFYFRASYIGYDFMPDEKRKPGKAELKLQLVLRYL